MTPGYCGPHGVAWGGEGIVLKDRRALYRPGQGSPTGSRSSSARHTRSTSRRASPELVRWGDWGWAVRLTLTYTHPHTGETVSIDEIVRVPQPDTFTLHIGASGTVLC
jgi:hypothetical protein